MSKLYLPSLPSSHPPFLPHSLLLSPPSVLPYAYLGSSLALTYILLKSSLVSPKILTLCYKQKQRHARSDEITKRNNTRNSIPTVCTPIHLAFLSSHTAHCPLLALVAAI